MPPRKMSRLVDSSNKNDFRIILDHHQRSKKHQPYTSNDHVNGKVLLTFSKATRLGSFEITLEGHASVGLEIDPLYGRSKAGWVSKHRFLLLADPGRPSFLPEGQIALAGVTYVQPFHFVVPERLLPYACTHHVDNDRLRVHHLELPPTFGHSSACCGGHIGPSNAEISYLIRFSLSSRNDRRESEDLVNVTVPLCVLPYREEMPPAELSISTPDYAAQVEKVMRQGVFSFRKRGRLAAEAAQPRTLHLSRSYPMVRTSSGTLIMVDVRFDPFEPSDQPPKLYKITTILRAQTFFISPRFGTVPNRPTIEATKDQEGCHTASFKLSTRSLTNLGWTQHEIDEKLLTSTRSLPSTPRTTAIPVEGTEAVSTRSDSRPRRFHWVTSIAVPIALPESQIFSPTFRSCTVSRTYTLDLIISHQTNSSGVHGSIVLRLPLQIATARNQETASLLQTREGATNRDAQMSANAHIQNSESNMVADSEIVQLRDMTDGSGSQLSLPSYS